ncbi:MAG: HEAT repeat domain-containing protein [Planctomycetota bacterium]
MPRWRLVVLALVGVELLTACSEGPPNAPPVQRLALPAGTWQPPVGIWQPTLWGGYLVREGFENRPAWSVKGGLEPPRIEIDDPAPDGRHVLLVPAGASVLLFPDRLTPARRAGAHTLRVALMSQAGGPDRGGRAFVVRRPDGWPGGDGGASRGASWREDPPIVAELEREGEAGSWTRLGGWVRPSEDGGELGLLLRAPPSEAAVFDALRIAAAGGTALGPEVPTPRNITRARFELSARDNRWAWPLWSNDTASVSVQVPRDAPRLTVGLAYLTGRDAESAPPPPPSPRSAVVTVLVRGAGEPRELERIEVKAARSAEEATWLERTWPLDRWAGRSVEIDFTCRTSDLHPDPDGVLLLGAPRVLGTPPGARAPNVILVSIDTLRADRLGIYGYLRATSPHIDALAQRGVLVERATSSSAYTLPGHASLFSGQYPSTHGAMDGETPLDADVSPHLAEALARAGYVTLAGTAGGYVDPFFGFARGFDIYATKDPLDPLIPTNPSETIPPGLRRILDRVAQVEDLPFFLFLHTYGVHDYHPLDEDLAPFRDRPGEDRTFYRNLQRTLLTDQKNDFKNASASQAEILSDLYDATIHGVDRVIGGLVDHLERHNLTANTLIVLTADHGEEFYEHQGLFHGRTLYEEILRVPLLFVGPDLPHGKRVPGPVSLVDIAPTLLGLLGVSDDEATRQMQGRDLRTHLLGSGPPSPFVLAELDYIRFSTCTYSEGEVKAMRRLFKRGTHASWEYELFDLAHDPGETRDTSADDPRTLCDFAGQMKERQERLQKARESWLRGAGSASARMSEDLRRELVSIGYTAPAVARIRGPSDAIETLERRERPGSAAAGASLGSAAEGDVETLRASLRSGRSEERVAAALALGRLGAAAASSVPDLIGALDENNASLQEEALCALGRIGEAARPATQRVIELASSPDPHRRLAAVFALGRVGVDATLAVPALRQALHDTESWVRRQAVYSLDAIGPAGSPAIPDLAALLTSSKGALPVARVLGKLGPAALPSLLELLRQGDTAAGCMVVETLHAMGMAVIPDLVRALSSEDDTIRGTATFTLGEMGASAIPYLVAVLANAEVRGKSAAAAVLCGIGQAALSAAPALLEAMNDETPEVRYWAATALGKLGPSVPEALGRLVDGLADPDPIVRGACALALASFGRDARGAVPAVIALLGDPDPKVRRHAATALGPIGEGDDSAVVALGQALSHADRELRLAAAVALKLMGRAALPAVEYLIRALEDPDEKVIRVVATALGSIGPPARGAVFALRRLLEHPNRYVRDAAREALEKIAPATK